jgi:formylglycine-generating enzyme
MVEEWRRLLLVAMGIATITACDSGNRVDPDAWDGSSGDGGVDGQADGGDGGTEGVAPPSCATLPASCGASGEDSCCSSPALPAGSYHRSYDSAGDASSGDRSFPATVSAFRLDKYEITVGRFRAFVAAGKGTQASPPAAGAGAHAAIVGSGWQTAWNTSLATDISALTSALRCNPTFQTWTASPGGNERRPINCITWYEAMAFCAWDGGYLATEAEWNYAAAGGAEQRAYPWSSADAPLPLDAARASYNDGTTCVGDGQAGCALTDLIAVGSKPAGQGRWGHADLGGNVMEWVLDWNMAYPSPCQHCALVEGTGTRALRGGHFNLISIGMRTAVRGGVPPVARNAGYGARCARAP